MIEQLEKEEYGPKGEPRLHLSLADLESGFDELADPPRGTGQLSVIVRRLADGTREMPESANLTIAEGLTGDGWSRRPPRDPDAQLTVMRLDIAKLIANGQTLALFGDNLLVDLDISQQNLPPGTRLNIGGCVVEVTAQPHTGCAKFRDRFGADALRLTTLKRVRDQKIRGIHWRVIEEGEIRVGDLITAENTE